MYKSFEGENGKLYEGEVILTESRLKVLAKKLSKVDEFAYDTETNTLRVQHKGEMSLVGISICFGIEDTYYIPTGHYFDDEQLSVKTVVKYLKPIFEREDVRIIGWNLKYDLHVLANVGIHIKTEDIFDGMIARWITDENESKSLKECTSNIYGVNQAHFDSCLATVTKEQKAELGLKANNKAQFWMVKLDVGAPYALADAYWTWRHYVDWQMDEINNEEMNTIFYKVQMPFLKTLYNMERRGVKINKARLEDMNKRAEKDLQDLEYKIIEIAGVKFNIGSSQQLCEILFGYKKVNKKGEFTGNVDILEKSFNYPIVAKTPSGAPKTGESELVALTRANYKRDVRKQEGIQMIKLILKYKRLNKLKSAFIEGLIKQCYDDGKVHPSFNQVGCLTSETLIPTDKGIYPIGDIANLGEDGEFVEKQLNILNRYRELEQTKYVVKYVNRETVKLETVLGFTIEGTLNHPLIVNKYNTKELTNNIDNCRLKGKYIGAEEWRKLEDIEVGDCIAIPYDYNLFSNEYVKLDIKQPKYNTNAIQIKYPQVIDEELAELMGIYFADGSIHSNNGSYSIRITNGSKDVISRVKYLSKSLFNLEAKVYIDSIKNSATISLTSKALEQLEESLELNRGCVNKVIPKCILQSPRSVVIAFLRGVTLDSCVIREKNKLYLKYTTSNEISARYIQEILLNLGIISSRRADVSKTNNVHHVCVYNEEYIKFREIIGFIEQDKYCILDKTTKSSPKYRLDIESKTIWVKVNKVVRGYNDVYDFNVPNTHSFVSGAFISHNTDSGRLSCSEPNLQQLPRPIEFYEHKSLEEWAKDEGMDLDVDDYKEELESLEMKDGYPTGELVDDMECDAEFLMYLEYLKSWRAKSEEAIFWKFYEIRDCFITDTDDEYIIALD